MLGIRRGNKMQVSITQATPGTILSASVENQNFNSFTGSINSANLSTDALEHYHLTLTGSCWGLAESVENGTFTTASYSGSFPSNAPIPITHNTALEIPTLTVPASSSIFIQWNQQVYDYVSVTGDPDERTFSFILTWTPDGGSEENVVSGLLWTYDMWVWGKETSIPSCSTYTTGAFEYHKYLPAGGSVAYHNNSGSPEVFTDLRLNVIPSYYNDDDEIVLLNGALSCYIVRNDE